MKENCSYLFILHKFKEDINVNKSLYSWYNYECVKFQIAG